MEDDKIIEIFKEFDPELSSSFQFITKLKKNMEAMEMVRQYYAAQKRRNKWAVAIAGVCGFTMGVILTLLLPFITDWIVSNQVTIPLFSANNLTIDFRYLGLILMSCASVLTSLSVYEIALARLPLRQKLSNVEDYR